MDKIQSAEFATYTIPLEHIDQNMDIVKELPAAVIAANSARGLVNSVLYNNQKWKEQLSGVVVSKEEQRKELGIESDCISSAISSYASDKGDDVLRKSMDFKKKDLFQGAARKLGDISANILAAGRRLLPELGDYGVTQVQLDAYEGLMKDYVLAVDAPRATQADQSAAGIMVGRLLQELGIVFTERLDKMMVQFQKKHPAYYQEYLIKRTLVKPGRHYTQLQGIITNKLTGAPLSGVQATSVEKKRTASSNAEGEYTLKAAVFGEGSFVFEKPGFKTVSVSAVLKRGRTTHLDVVMEPI